MSNIEQGSEGPGNQPDVPWWRKLPSEQTVRVVVAPKFPASADEQLSLE